MYVSQPPLFSHRGTLARLRRIVVAAAFRVPQRLVGFDEASGLI